MALDDILMALGTAAVSPKLASFRDGLATALQAALQLPASQPPPPRAEPPIATATAAAASPAASPPHAASPQAAA
eukprot:3110106-Prymnesium_polylepis.1